MFADIRWDLHRKSSYWWISIVTSIAVRCARASANPIELQLIPASRKSNAVSKRPELWHTKNTKLSVHLYYTYIAFMCIAYVNRRFCERLPIWTGGLATVDVRTKNRARCRLTVIPRRSSERCSEYKKFYDSAKANILLPPRGVRNVTTTVRSQGRPEHETLQD